MNRVCRNMPVMLAVAALSVTFFPTNMRGQDSGLIQQTGPAQPVGLAQLSAPSQQAGPLLVAKIVGSLSTRNAKAGDVVTAKTVKACKLQDGTDIPKGSKIVGKLSSVQSKKAGDGSALMTFRLDQIEVKGGSTVPIHGLIVAIGPAVVPKNLFGANSVMNRNATDMANVLDPNTGMGSAGAMNEEDIRMGSTLQGVSLGRHIDADWTTALKGIHQDIDLDSDIVVKVQLK